jgi:hypothetical protein
MEYYLGAYYLIKLRPASVSGFNNASIYTCSTCINDGLLGNWSYSWTTNNDDSETFKLYGLEEEKVKEVRDWVDQAYEDKNIGWMDTFKTAELAKKLLPEIF